MVINMDETKLRTIAQLQDFLNPTPDVRFSGIDAADGDERYAQISRVLKRFDYPHRPRGERGVILAYLQRISGYSRAQISRLVARWHESRHAAVPLTKRYRAPAAPFARKYTASDIELLVEMDRAHEDVCGPAIAHLLRRAYTLYGDKRYERLASLSVSHLYNLRKSRGYQALRVSVTKTRPVCHAQCIRSPLAGWSTLGGHKWSTLGGRRGLQSHPAKVRQTDQRVLCQYLQRLAQSAPALPVRH